VISRSSFDPTTSPSSPAQRTAYFDHTHYFADVGSLSHMEHSATKRNDCVYEPYDGNPTRQDETIDNYIETLTQIELLQDLEGPKFMTLAARL